MRRAARLAGPWGRGGPLSVGPGVWLIYRRFNNVVISSPELKRHF